MLVSRELLKMERRLREPPLPSQEKASNGLKGGVAVLVVATFEAFLQAEMAERLQPIVTNVASLDAGDLPESIWTYHVFESLNRAMKGHRLSPAPPRKSDRVPSITRVSRDIVSGVLDPIIFCDTMGNPNPENVRSIFKNVGFNDILAKVKVSFERRWGSPVSSTFIEGKLQEIIDRRNRVAHNADTRGIARSDLAESLLFMTQLAAVLDQELGVHMKQVARSMPRRSRPII